jgi:Eco57I restriction-modification methylase
MPSQGFASENVGALNALTKDWGTPQSVTLYLDRCQVDTPRPVVEAVWKQICSRRKEINRVIDFGAGDGRFASGGPYRKYIGYEIDTQRCHSPKLPRNAVLINKCAFSEKIEDADVCIGNPPYVRNQDLPNGWRERAAQFLSQRTGITLSGLANAWQYFFLLSLASTRSDGLVALVIPYEWVSRPAVASLREYIKTQKWDVSVYRLRDDTFHRVLTTSSITLVDKGTTTGQWKYFEQLDSRRFRPLHTPSGGLWGVLPYARHTKAVKRTVFAKRGLSPGTQEVLTLTEGERCRLGLRVGTDVVPCVTTLKSLGFPTKKLSTAIFDKYFKNAGLKCWLINTSKYPSAQLKAYLDNVPKEKYQTSTCLSRDNWWKFASPEAPNILVATGFRTNRPKVIVNAVGARAVGGVCGVYGLGPRTTQSVATGLRRVRLTGRIVAHSNGLRKMEINQLNSLLDRVHAAKKRKLNGR